MLRLPRYWTYLLLSDRGETYAGYTSNLRRRLREHNAPQNRGWTRGRRWRLVEAERFFDRRTALWVERLLKGRGPRGKRLRAVWLERKRDRVERLRSDLSADPSFSHEKPSAQATTKGG